MCLHSGLPAANLEGDAHGIVVAQHLAVMLIVCGIKLIADGMNPGSAGGINIQHLVEHFTAFEDITVRLTTNNAFYRVRIFPAVLQFYPCIVHVGTSRGLYLIDEILLDLVAAVIAVQVANNDDGARVQTGENLVTQLVPLFQTRITIKTVLALAFVGSVASIHVHVIDHHLLSASQRQLITTKALGHHLVKRMTELAEVGRPGRAAGRGQYDAFLPSAHQTVTLKAVILQMQEVYLVTVYTHVATPRVQLIVVLQGDCQLLMIVEVLLHKHHVVASLLEVAANSDAATAAGYQIFKR